MDNLDYKKRKKKPDRFPLLLAGGFFVILVVMVITVAAKDTQKSNTTESPIESENVSEEKSFDVNILGVIKDINQDNGSITIINSQDGQEILLYYSGGTQILDKYDQSISKSKLAVGEMVDSYYNGTTFKLSKLQISNKVFEYKGISNWSMNTEEQSLTVVNSKYKYSDLCLVTRDGVKLSVSDLDTEDVLTIKGIDREILSILVTKGHGVLHFEGYEDFLGGTAYIGTKKTLEITENMDTTVREGDYDVTFEKGSLKGTKSVTVTPGEEILVDMSEFKKPPIKKGLVNFSIMPEGADLYLDNLLVDYGQAIELEYGSYDLKVSLGGYTTYTGKLDLEESEKEVNIKLVEANSNDDTVTPTTDDQNNNSSNTPSNGSSDEQPNGESGEETDQQSQEEVNAKNYIYIEEPKGASVYFNGEFKGTAPVSFPKINGTQYITLIQSGFATKTYTVEVMDDGEDVKLSFPDMTTSE